MDLDAFDGQHPDQQERKIRKMQNFCLQFANEHYFADSGEIDGKYAAYAADWYNSADLLLLITINKLNTYGKNGASWRSEASINQPKIFA